MQCPKDRKTPLVANTLTEHLPVQSCPDCKGTWIRSADYEAWQATQPQLEALPQELPAVLDVDFVQSPFDTKAALCPECNHYLARARVGLSTPFYVERCPNCAGIWCDHGEWEVLAKLGLHTTIERLFSSEWQARVREKVQADQERQATIDKLGPELAAKVFELADALKQHPNGDFGVAYLMRRFDQ